MLEDKETLRMLEEKMRSNDLRLDTLQGVAHEHMHPPIQYLMENEQMRGKMETLKEKLRLTDQRVTNLEGIRYPPSLDEGGYNGALQ